VRQRLLVDTSDHRVSLASCGMRLQLSAADWLPSNYSALS